MLKSLGNLPMEGTMEKSNSYQSLHGPVGANAAFAIGMAGRGGGFMHQDAFVPEQDLYIGTCCKDSLTMLPFFAKATSDYRESFVKSDNSPNPLKISYYTEDQIQRTYGQAYDGFDAKNGQIDLKFELFSPGRCIPDPSKPFSHEEMKYAVCPSILTRLTIDNTKQTVDIKGFFGVGGLKGLAFLDEMVGVATIDGYGFAAQTQKGLRVAADFDPVGVFGRERPAILPLAPMAMLLFDVPAGEIISIDIALAWYQEGCVTQGANRCKFYYTHFYKNIFDVFSETFRTADRITQEAFALEAQCASSQLNEARKFLLGHSIQSYHVSTMLFDEEFSSLPGNSQPRWCVNEGSFMMMNTFDLAIDHAFYELAKNPWVVRNVLDIYVKEYSYIDTLHSADAHKLPGGSSFTHDHGSHFTFTPHQYSSYEITDQDGCFSYMTQEQLCNWILTAGLYVEKTQDLEWLMETRGILEACLTSMVNRDATEEVDRDGVMDLDSDRCGASSEITTYDSLDHSLGQARRNLYVATKCWSSYVVMSHLFQLIQDAEALISTCDTQAHLCANTISSYYDEKLGFIPAILDHQDQSAIIPAIEALIYPYFSGCKEALSFDGPFSNYLQILKKHTQNILKPGLCLFEDGGWKLSSKNSNSWISKIFLCQFSAEEILLLKIDEQADYTHMDWWINGCCDCPGIDQIYEGKVSEHGFHYPRAVSSYIWLSNQSKKETKFK